ncbi:hypothetical protein [Streptomyces sp. AD55]|uniref:hypothetical protein n=1 Tax=Streptomyces sp. AD55 TaxID=3242895 RepID=UPI003527F0BC
MDLDTLCHTDFTKLGEAVTDWEQMTKNLVELKKDAEDNLNAKSLKAKWAGVNAAVSREFITRTAAEFADAHTQADSIAKILRDTHDELVGYRTQLNDAIARAHQQSLTVSDTGGGTFTVVANTRPDWAADPSGESGATDQKVVDAFREEIQGILAKATRSDTSAAQVLRLLVDQAKYGFSDASYADRDEAAKAVAAAEKLAEMAKDPSGMTLEDIAAFNKTMGRYQDDPLFAEQFAKRLGAKGTLQFWTEMAYTHAGARNADLETMKDLQTKLGLTLATASFSDSDAMRDWKKDLIAERNTNFRASGSPLPVGALGAQVISSLLREGRFDTEFLDDYRKQLFKADKAAGDSNTNDLWVKGYDTVDLVFGDGDGRDPLEGLFAGLSHNPEAAVHAFASSPDLDHLLATVKYTDRAESLGQALESAVTGVARGDIGVMAPPHSEAQVEIMNNVMHAVAVPGADRELVKKMGDSLGTMAAAYMPEISQKIAGKGSDAIFLTDSSAPDGLKNVEDVIRFLSVVAEDPSGRAGIILGETIYTSSLIEAHLTDPTLFDGSPDRVLESIGKNAGILEGTVAHSVADSEVRAAVAGEKEYNDALKEKGEFAKSWTAIGLAGVKLPERLGGEVMGSVIGGGVGAIVGGVVDRVIEGQKLDGTRDEALYHSAGDLYDARDSATQQTLWAAEEVIDHYKLDFPRDGTSALLREAVADGWDASSEALSSTRERPRG